MADTNHTHGPARTEGDGIAYRGLGWSMLILAVIIFSPSGLAGLWARLKRAVVRWPYTT